MEVCDYVEVCGVEVCDYVEVCGVRCGWRCVVWRCGVEACV